MEITHREGHPRQTMSTHDNLPNDKTRRIALFADLRDSTDILVNFEQRVYPQPGNPPDDAVSYERFIYDVHESLYKELYLGHEGTYAEVYGDGIMGVFPEDNAKYILENLYGLTTTMRSYNDAIRTGMPRPMIDMGFGISVGEVAFVHYPFDGRDHPVGQCIHEAARIESITKLYDARILISHRFFGFAEAFLDADPRFAYRFIDRVILKGFREPVTLFELLLDNDPRYKRKKAASPAYTEAYGKYCEKDWSGAKEIFLAVFREYGLGCGAVMAKRCDILANSPPNHNWNGIWSMKDK